MLCGLDKLDIPKVSSSVSAAVIPLVNSVIKCGWESPELNGGLDGTIIELNGGFSSVVGGYPT